ncbi:tetraacyldisaccharide 4'-kinase [Stieleria sp. TO1_6]|uniref:tetraacyldisaccharide 4'-kinase n=1 Tax=Stieleria tagensis TaxID=2956795 RepID=UPI00209B7D20|nr:tetraacyldisaccharide 4'-kinase [Stieleria tagensis]MCO8123839.1 tetraacyldisaccharide 4'-kinase [Stieleria tagensis]
MSGRRKDPVAMLMRCGLSIASLPYGAAVALRNRRFDQGKNPAIDCDAVVISVGNLTTGGTGKTPIVARLAKWFREHGIRVAIVSRGYGRGDADQNDEAAELHQRLPDVPHVQDADRVNAARIAVEELESQLILMDDGFQHRRLARQLDLVLIDMTCPFGFGHLLPRGLLREPVSSLRRADAVVLTRCDQVDPAQIDDVTTAIQSAHPGIVIVHCNHRPSGLLRHPHEIVDVDELRGKRVALVCGIGNPDAFRRTVQDVGATVVAIKSLADHAIYDRETMNAIREWIGGCDPVDVIVCTQKDLVKLQTDRIAGKPLVALTIDAEISDFDRLLPMLQQAADESRK